MVSTAAWLSSFVRLSCRYRHLIGRLGNRFSNHGLLATSCLAGIAYYLGLSFVTGPIVLIALQPLNHLVLRRHRRDRTAAVPAEDPPARALHGPLPEHPSDRLHRVRPNHRLRLPHRARTTRIFLASAVLTVIDLAIIGIADRTSAKPASNQHPPPATREESSGVIAT